VQIKRQEAIRQLRGKLRWERGFVRHES
jgi:hypothetical protein